MSADELVGLTTDHLHVLLDPGRGADILTLEHRGTGVDVLFSTPWRDHAEQIREGRSTPTTYDDFAVWLEQYRGGWQLLCPNAGPARPVAGAPVGFHGEASVARWEVTHQDTTSARLRASLFTVPVTIERTVTLEGASVAIADTLVNRSDVELEIDYVSHPAFGAAFLDGTCTIDTGARTLTIDPATDATIAAAGSVHQWPWADGRDEKVDLRDIPPAGSRRAVFGWLSDFEGHWASITNHDLGLTVRLEWDGTHLPHAWFWQELNASPAFPWYQRARVMAIEPSSTQSGGDQRASVLVLEPGGHVQISHGITIEQVTPGASSGPGEPATPGNTA